MVTMLMAASCGTNFGALDSSQTGFDDGTPHEWPEEYPKEGFQSHAEHKYGFDFSPNYPKVKNGEDGIAHISIPIGGTGYVTVFIDSVEAIDNEYYYCDPDNHNIRIDMRNHFLGKISTTSYIFIPNDLLGHTQEHALKIDNSIEEKIALCKESSDEVPVKVHELRTYRYELKKDYNFSTYIWGDEWNGSLRHQLINAPGFWDEFNKTYRQAVVEHGGISKNWAEPLYWEVYENGEYTDVLKEYILTRARAMVNYPSHCAKGELDRFMDTVEANKGYKGEKRVIVQLGYPVKRFWPLQKGSSNKIEICGPSSFYSENDPKKNSSLRLEPFNGKGCEEEEVWDVPVAWSSTQQAWILDFGNDVKRIATTSDIKKPECAIFVDTTSQTSAEYIEEITGNKNVAQAKDKGKATIIILPWLGEKTARAAIHELGHAMGLTDVDDARLSNSITNDSKEGNLMHSSDERKGFKLRKRGMHPSDPRDCASKGVNCVEHQWDCLHKKDNACLVPNLDPHLR